MNPRELLSFEIVRYGAISVIAFAVDLALLSVLTQGLRIHYLLASTCSFIAGGVVAYFLSIRFVFRYRRVQERTVEATAFVALGLAGLLVNFAMMALVVGGAGAHVLIGKLAAACATFGVNFLLRKFVLFTPRANDSAVSGP